MAVADESYPADLRYHPEHDWVRAEGDEAVFGITWYAQDALGEVVYYDPPEVGATVTKDSSYGELESVKAVSDIYRPRQRRGGRREPGGAGRGPRSSTRTPTARAGSSACGSPTRPSWTP